MAHVPPEQWLSIFETVDSSEIAASLLDYSTYWRTPDGSERMPALSMQQAKIAGDHVIADLNDRINAGRTELAGAPALWWSPSIGLIRGGTNGGHEDAIPLTPAAREGGQGGRPS